MKKRNGVINPGDGKGPRKWCARCEAWLPAEQQSWPKSGYILKKHTHTTVEKKEGK